MFVWLCDDGPPSRGPAGFHTRSLQSLFRDVRGVVIVACEPHALFYTELPRLWRRKELIRREMGNEVGVRSAYGAKAMPRRSKALC
jgi:hypothetical protein